MNSLGLALAKSGVVAVGLALAAESKNVARGIALSATACSKSRQLKEKMLDAVEASNKGTFLAVCRGVLLLDCYQGENLARIAEVILPGEGIEDQLRALAADLNELESADDRRYVAALCDQHRVTA